MNETQIEQLFHWLNETTEMIGEHLDEPYLDSLTLTLEAVLYGDISEQIDQELNNKVLLALQKLNYDLEQTDQLKKAMQLAILKGMKDSTQTQHQMTPEAIALFIGYLAKKLIHEEKQIRLFDPVSGTGNLLLTVMDQLDQEVQAYASEIDPTLLKLAVLNADLQKKRVEFFHQDSLRSFLLDPVDLVIGDLPVGYYPDDVRASEFELKAKEGHAFAHHLLIEQSVKYTKDGGYLIFIIPNSLFDSEQSDQLHAFIQKYAHIIGVLQLPESIFKAQEQLKSILILQKQGEQTETPKQPLLVNMPSFNNVRAMEDIIGQINGWFAEFKP